jgi:hypothetical protein
VQLQARGDAETNKAAYRAALSLERRLVPMACDDAAVVTIGRDP